MQFRYIGTEHSHFMGHEWINGLVHDVTDEHAIKKLSNSVLFEKVDGEKPKAEKAPKPQPEPEVLADEKPAPRKKPQRAE